MSKDTRFFGLDVHKETIAVAVAEPNGEVRSLGTIPNNAEAIAKLVKKQGEREKLTFCYEAGPTGYVLYWQFVKLGVSCVVVAPTLVPVKAGDRVKTDRRDAEKLARCYRAGDLSPVWVPTAEHEGLRDLVRARESAKKDQRRGRQRLLKFLLRRGVSTPAKMRLWTEKHRQWVWSLTFALAPQQATLSDYATEVDHARDRVLRLEKAIEAAITTAPASMRAVIEALQSMRGVSQLVAVTVVAEVGELSRFEHPRQLMGYSGAVPSEHSSGSKTQRGAITKTGNSHLRRVLVEGAWSYRHRPRIIGKLRKRQEGVSDKVKAIAWKAQERLCARYRKLSAKGKVQQNVVTAIAREMLGFIWAIGVEVERLHATPPIKETAA